MDFISFIIDTWWLWIIIVIVTSFAICFSSDEKEKRQLKRENDLKESEKKLEYQNQYNCEETFLGIKHLYGLNIPQNANCDLWICKDCLVIYYGAPIVLNHSKIIASNFLTEEQLKKHYVDNTTGAIAGGLAFGTVGAIIGGGTKTVYETNKKNYLTVTYKSNDETNSIIFDVTDSKVIAKKIVIMLNNKITSNEHVIEL